MIMDQTINENLVSHLLAEKVAEWATPSIGNEGFGLIGAVVGATATHQAKALRERMPHSILLVPGMGAQGGDLETVLSTFNEDGLGAIIPISRGITYSKDRGQTQIDYKDSIRQQCQSFVTAIQKGLSTR